MNDIQLQLTPEVEGDTMDEPIPVTKLRRWKAVAYFEVDETPDPAYDVSAHERLADALYLDVQDALKTIPLAREVYVEDVMVEGD